MIHYPQLLSIKVNDIHGNVAKQQNDSGTPIDKNQILMIEKAIIKNS